MPQLGSHIVGDAELRRDARRSFGVLRPAKMTLDRLHMVNGKIDHLVE
jgi:hypothetical protein